MKPLALTSGEPAGIGPELCVQLAAQGFAVPVSVIGDPDLLAARAALLGVDIHIRSSGEPAFAPGELHVTPVRLRTEAHPGQLDAKNATYVLETLDQAVSGCISGKFAGMVTAPVHKGVINDADMAFTGHTEYLAAKLGCERVVMMLAANNLRVALATTHLPLRKVPDAISRESLQTVIEILHAGLRERFGIAEPRILVLGLNPHAGESGHLGREEIEIIQPVVDAFVAKSYKLHGPLPADTAFTPQWLNEADAVLAMYHDQGLPVLKYAGFGHAVNITLGLPIVRTSVDHGTALGLAGTGRADTGSLKAAITMARKMADVSASSSPLPSRERPEEGSR